MAIDSAIERLSITRSSRTAQLTIVVYAAALVAARASASLFSIEASVACNAALLFVLLNHVALATASADVRPALIGLALVPLLRIESIALPQQFLPSVYWEALPMALVLATVFWLQRVANVRRRLDARSQPSEDVWPAQVAMSLLGVSLAVVAAYALFALDLTDERPGLVSTPPSVLLVAAFSGVALEIVFRGVIQRELVALFGWSGVVLTSLVYAALFIGSGWFLVVLALVTGLVWGAFSAVTRSVGGVAGSHALYAMTWAALF